MINEKELQTGYEKKYGMAENSVRSLLASSDGNLYVGYMAGLAVFSPGQDAITHVYTTRDGLCSNFIGCMTEDADALSIFDQVVSFTGGNITYKSVIENLFRYARIESRLFYVTTVCICRYA